MSEGTKHRRRLPRYSLASLFLSVTAVCVWLTWEISFISRRVAAMKWLKDGNGWSVSGAEWCSFRPPLFNPDGSSFQIPIWRSWLGDEPVLQIGFEPGTPAAERARVRELFPEAYVSDE